MDNNIKGKYSAEAKKVIMENNTNIITCSEWINERFLSNTDFNRFWIKVNKEADNKCWEWTGCKSAQGYGLFGANLGNSSWQSTGAHRISFALNNPDEIMPPFVCHSCDNKICVNPDHLFQGNALINNRDAKSKGRNNPFPNMNGGQFHPTAKLSSLDVATIVRMRELGMPVKDLKLYFKVSPAAITRIAHHKIRYNEYLEIKKILETLNIKYNKN